VRFKLRGLRAQPGICDHGQASCPDAAAALDWAQSESTPRPGLAGLRAFSFGSMDRMQLLMRRPEIEGFISIGAPANLYDFRRLRRPPVSGLIVHGDKDAVVPHKGCHQSCRQTQDQKGIVIDQKSSWAPTISSTIVSSH